tara:strand:- start:197 stop:754 length:558 start_codon:yes stop_codon:yes gene_type:complete
MRKNRGKILTKVQDVVGIKNGKYCSSDVSVVSLNGNNGGGAVSAFKGEVQQQSVTYVNCPNRETVTIDFNEIQMNNNIINDCVLGGSVILNDLNGYVVNYGQTICPVITPNVKQIQGCESVDLISIDFGDNIVTDGLIYSLIFNGTTKPGCYRIIGDTLSLPTDSISGRLLQVPDCKSCTPIPPQ